MYIHFYERGQGGGPQKFLLIILFLLVWAGRENALKTRVFASGMLDANTQTQLLAGRVMQPTIMHIR